MRLKYYIIMLLAVFAITVRPAFSQSVGDGEYNYFNPLTDDITKRLPPLRVLVDSAGFNSPEVKYENLKADYYYYEQISAAREWLEYLSINLDAVYGHWDYRDKDELTRVDRYYYSESWRSTGAVMFYIRMPLGALFDRQNRINKQKKWIEISLTQREINKRYLEERVITYYNDLVSAQAQIRIYNDYQQFTLMQMQMAKNEWINGEISTAEYTRLKEIQTSGAVNFQKAIADFNKNYQTLEVLTGIKFNLITVLR